MATSALAEAPRVEDPELEAARDALGRRDLAAALALADRILARDPESLAGWEILGVARYQSGAFSEAAHAMRRLADLQPGDAASRANLGAVLRAAGRDDEAQAAYAEALSCDPGRAATYYNLGNLHLGAGRLAQAESAYRSAVGAESGHAAAWRSLAITLQRSGRPAEAVEAYDAVLAITPDDAQTHSDKGLALMALDQSNAARDSLARAIALDPANALAHGNLGALYLRGARLVEAEAMTRRARELDPGQHRWLSNLAVIAKDLGRWDEAEQLYRQALDMAPDYALGHSNLLFCLNYHPERSAAEIFEEYRRWDAAHAAPHAPARPGHANEPDPARRLRVGYVSPDFREHSARHFIEPILAHHDPAEIEIYCYAEVANPDAQTERFQALAQHWRSTVGLGDDAVAALIAADGIDILVDLGGHTASSRLPAFARKPAPVQIEYLLGHGYTSGLSAMDAFLGDGALTPPGCEDLFSETVVRLPRLPLAYQPPEGMPEPTPSPALANGFTTFGYFGRPERLNDKVIAAWSAILTGAPGARLRLNSKAYGDPAFRDLIAGRFAAHGVGADRLDMVYTTPQTTTWAAYGEIDIALDPFPHNAGTTTIEALWLGVPVLSVNDRPSVGRFGASILGALDLADWAAPDVATYVAMGIAAARNPEGPAALRATLRQRFEASPLFDGAGLARAMEGAYRELWRAWCGREQSHADHDALRALFVAGDMEGVEALAGRLIAGRPDHPAACHFLGLVAFSRGDHAAARPLLEQAAGLEPTAPILSNLGACRRALGDVAGAEAAYRQALDLDANCADAWRNLVNLLIAARRLDEAVEILRAEAEVSAEPAPIHQRIGDLLAVQGRADEAVKAYANALRAAPTDAVLRRKLAQALENGGFLAEAAAILQGLAAQDDEAVDTLTRLSDLERRRGRLAQAEAAARQACDRDAGHGPAWNMLGAALTAQNRLMEAEAAFDQAIACNPDSAEAYNNRALSLQKRGQPAAAERDLRRGLELRPDLTEIAFNLGGVLQDQGRVAEAWAVLSQAIAVGADNPRGHGAALFCASYQTDLAPEEIFSVFQAWDARHARKFLPETPPVACSAQGRRLRIGYVSPDFSDRSAAYFIAPLLEGHDRAQVEVFAYAEVARPDATTERFQALADHWRPTVGLSDDAVAELIAADAIDVLIDLGGHTANNRLLALARKPAPLQIAHFLGHGYTSGLAAMDVFLADEALAPAGCEASFAEQMVRLPRIPIAYSPPAGMPEPGPPPALARGHVTFGHFGRIVRLNDEVIGVWAEILRQVDGSRLMLNAAPFSDPEVRARYEALFAAQGVAAERLDLLFTTPQPRTWEAYGGIDIALDPFPHNAGTTTIEALWLGVPVVSLADRPSVGRFGASILGAVGLEDWVAHSRQAYVARAVAAAADLEGLAELRAGLRERVAASPLCDGAGLARALEETYRALHAARVETPVVPEPPQVEPRVLVEVQALFAAGDLEGAAAKAQGILDRAPGQADARHVLGLIAYRRGLFAEAAQQLDALAKDHPRADILSNLGAAWRAQGDLTSAEAAYRQALSLNPDLLEAGVNIANLLVDRRKPSEAEAILRPLIDKTAAPDATALTTLGNTYYHQGKLIEAAEAFEGALAADPGAYDACRNLGSTRAALGQYAQAEALHRKALEIRPDYAGAHSSLLFNLNYRPDLSAEQIFAEYKRWDERHATPLRATWRPHATPPLEGRRLRIGYVSPDFSDHVVSMFMLPLLEAHDRRRVEITCYAEVRNLDAVSDRVKAVADHWVNTVGLSDEALAERIRADGVDVLIDLAGHSTGNRLLVFARRPAPVQLSYLLGHGYTTGLSAVDGFLADGVMVPPGADALFSEAVVRLPRPPLVYAPPAAMPAVIATPALRKGHVTFGHFGRAVRLNDGVLGAWARILNAVPGSRLMLNNAPFADAKVAALFRDRFAGVGGDPERLDLVCTSPQSATWAAYGEIDIALDPFPHNAGTTTIEALWMGVPVVSIADRPSVGRFGAMILGAVGLGAWVAADLDAYVTKAVAASQDIEALDRLRQSLRGRFEASPLADAPGLARAMEDAYEQLWRAKAGGPVQKALPAPVSQAPADLTAAIAAFQSGDFGSALAEAEAALADHPGDAQALHLQGLAAYRLGRLDVAVAAVSRAAAAAPERAEMRWNLCAILRAAGRLPEAVAQGLEAVRLSPEAAQAHNNLGNALKDMGRVADAEAALRRAVELDPKAADGWSSLAFVLSTSGRAHEAEEAALKAIALNPRDANAQNNLGSALLYQDRLDEAAEAFRLAVRLKPDFVMAHSNLLFCLNYRSDLAGPAIFEEYRRWNDQHAAHLAPESDGFADWDRSPGRRMRVGYVSADFRHHAAGFFVEPWLEAHDRRAVEIFAYAEVANPDAVTDRFKAICDQWRSTVGLSDDQVADMIRRDRIDVLVDLGGHTAGNRLLVFARRPAPVMVAHMVGAGQTTGLEVFDAFVADEELAPDGAEAVFSEPLARLSRIPLAYRPPADMPEVTPLPARRKGHVTFGCFSRTARINDGVLDVWAAILRKVPGSRLMLNSKPFQEADAREAFAARFEARGVEAGRLDLVYTTPQPATWAAYGEVDIALDPFPHNAGTTTIEALWLGVPVVSLKDRAPVGRFGASILGAVGLSDWVADSARHYIRKAVEAARDLEALAGLRAGLRHRFLLSPLGDPAGLAREMEELYQHLLTGGVADAADRALF